MRMQHRSFYLRTLRHHHRRLFFYVIVNGRDDLFQLFELKPGEHVMTSPVSVNVGHQVNCGIAYLDQNGNPMLTTPTPDAAPTWSNAPAPAGAATLTAAPGGLTAVDVAAAVGSDVVTVTLLVGGVSFTASVPVTIAAAPQVLTSIAVTTAVQ
jgi:hypothetical protein